LKKKLIAIVIISDPGVDLIKKPGFEIHGLTQVNPNQLGKILKKIFKILIFHMKKLRNNPYEYRLYVL